MFVEMFDSMRSKAEDPKIADDYVQSPGCGIQTTQHPS